MKKIWHIILSFAVSLFSDQYVKKRYKQAGAIFGDASSYSFMGECANVKRLLGSWAFWEQEFIRRGYRSVSLDQFIGYGGWAKPLENFGEKRNEGEKPTFHADIYRKLYLGRIKPAIKFSALLEGELQVGEYTSPSTEE